MKVTPTYEVFKLFNKTLCKKYSPILFFDRAYMFYTPC